MLCRLSVSAPGSALPDARLCGLRAFSFASSFGISLAFSFAFSLLALFAAGAATAVPAGQFQIVAHADDDLYFMNPAVQKSLENDEPSMTVFLTAGDAGGPPDYWPLREDGIRAAYAAMAGKPDVWLPYPLVIGGKTLHAVSLQNDPDVVLVFLRLADGNGDGSGNMTTGFESLQQLWELPEGEIMHTVDAAEQYTRSELIATLVALIEAQDPAVLRTQDPTGYNGDDHSDHVHGARFAFEAFSRLTAPRPLRAYRAYNIATLPINLSLGERDENATIQAVYREFDLGAHPNAWNDREIGLFPLVGTRASLAWQGPGMAGECLATIDPGLPTAALEFAPCNDSPSQTFLVGERSLRQGDECLTSPGLGGPAGSLGLAACDGSLSQSFSFFSDGHIRHVENQCVQAAGGVPIVAPCDPLSRLFSPQAQPAQVAGGGTDFSAAEWLMDPARSGSLSFGDLNGDARDDVCARRADGIHCALALPAGNFLPAAQWTDEFDDAGGWSSVESGSTLMLGDLDGDSRADICGRAVDGVYCALSWWGLGFAPATLWTTTFSDADGGGAPASYRSLRLADVDGDGDADLCGYREDGSGSGPGVTRNIDCLESDGTSFGAPKTWLGSEWTTSPALPPGLEGLTMMFGDLDGDGAADLCERGVDGVHCALSDPGTSTFVDARPSSLGAFSDSGGWDLDEAYYGTLRLADMTGDGRADLCGRSDMGLVCLFSMDGRFSPTAHRLSPDFSDSAGYLDAFRGPTLSLPDLDGDGRGDVCASGATALVCATLAGPLAVPEPDFFLGLGIGTLCLARRRGRNVRNGDRFPSRVSSR